MDALIGEIRLVHQRDDAGQLRNTGQRRAQVIPALPYIVQPDQPQPSVPAHKLLRLIGQHPHTGFRQVSVNGRRIGPVIVVAQDGIRAQRRSQGAEHINGGLQIGR
jgi:hypothetical protein